MTGNLVFQYMGRCINCKDILATLTVINPAPNRTQEGILKNDKFASQPDFKSHVDQVCGENMELFNPGEYAAVLVEFKSGRFVAKYHVCLGVAVAFFLPKPGRDSLQCFM